MVDLSKYNAFIQKMSEKLDISNTGVSDISSLVHLKLEELNISNTFISI